MRTYLLLECPRCQAQRLFPDSPSTDQLTRAIGLHLARRHPSILPTESEQAMEQALSGVEPRTVEDDSKVTVEAWDDYGL